MIFLSVLIVCLGILQQQFFTTGELMARHSINSIENDDDDSGRLLPIPGLVGHDDDGDKLPTAGLVNLDPNDPLSSINIDYTNNAVILHFRRTSRFSNDGGNGVEPKRRALDNNFMRFGRAGGGDLMRFGKRQLEAYGNSVPANEVGDRYERSNNGGSSSQRDSRGDSFMRFGRSADGSDVSGNSANMMRFGRPDNLMRFGRPDNLMRFGRSDSLMRFGRPDNLMRFGRADKNFMRFGRPENFMRFGRTSPSLMRFGRTDKNFMRFGKLDQNFMRFGKRSSDKSAGKSDENGANKTTTTSATADRQATSNDLDILFNTKPKDNVNNDLEFDDSILTNFE